MSSSHSFDPELQAKLKEAFQIGLEKGCPRDQLLHFTSAGIVLQHKQLAASAAARLCDKPDGPIAVGYGGARGGGKTHWLFAQLGADDCQRRPGLKCLLLRKVGKSNLENAEDLRQRLFHLLPHEFTASRGIFRFANGSQIRLGHFQCEKDIDTYLGLQYDVIGIEEATQLTARKYQDISTCCRTSKPNWRPRVYSTTNPGGIGHQWYYEKFIVPYECRTETATRFVRALVDDNAFVNPDYRTGLASCTGWQYTAWYKGEWNISAGQYFRNFARNSHVLPDDFQESIATKWVASMDYGYTHLTVVLLGCFDDKDNLYIVDEHAERFWIPRRHAQAVKAMLARHHVYSTEDHLRQSILAQHPQPSWGRDQLCYNGKRSRMLSRFVAGADIFSAESSGDSVADQYRNLGLSLSAANMDRVSGWSAILQRLGDPAADIKPTLFIHPRCKHLLECLPYLQHDPDRPGDLLKTNINEDGLGGDDPADALRYLVATRPNQLFVEKLQGF